MSKNTKIAIGIIAGLCIVLVGALLLNKEGLDERKEMFTSAQVTLKDSGNEICILNFEDIKAAGEETFEAVYDTSKTEPVTLSYTGVQLKNVLSQSGIELEGKTTVVLSAVDGYTVAYILEEVMEEGNVYLTYAEEGEMLKSREEGGSGPYQTIVVSDTFSSRRCKWLTSIEVQ